MCIFSISSKNGENCVEDAGVADRSADIWGLESNGTENRLNSIPIRTLLSDNMLHDVACLKQLLHVGD